MESDSKSDNIILGPWSGSGKKPPKKTLSKTDKIQLDMLHIDELSESVMIQMIHTIQLVQMNDTIQMNDTNDTNDTNHANGSNDTNDPNDRNDV